MEEPKKRLVVQGEFEDVFEIDGHYYLQDKKDKVAVIPYTISSEGLIDKIGVVQDWNYIEEEEVLTLLNNYISSDDATDLVAANRVLFETTKINIKTAKDWMYLGAVYSNLTSDSPIKLYAVDISNIKIQEEAESIERKKFKLMDASSVIRTDEILFLAAYFRLFNTFYVKSLNKK
jgi:ribosomal protein L20A (L18A)